MLETAKTIEEIENKIEEEIKLANEVFKEYNLTAERTLDLLDEFSRRVKRTNSKK